MPTKPDCYTLGSTTNKELQQQSQEMALYHKRIKQEQFRESMFGVTSLKSSSTRKTESLKPSGTQITTASNQMTRSPHASKHFTNSLSHCTDPAVSHRCSNKADQLSPKAAVAASQTVHEHWWSSDVKGKVVCEKNDVGRIPPFKSGGENINPFDSAVNYKWLEFTEQKQQAGVKLCPPSTKSEEITVDFPVLRPISPCVPKTVVKKETQEMSPNPKSNEDKMKCLSGDVYQGNEESIDDDVIITEVEPGKRKKKDDLCALLLAEGKFFEALPN